MLITIKLPDNAIRIMYSEGDGSGYESEPRNVTMGMLVKVEPDKESSREGE